MMAGYHANEKIAPMYEQRLWHGCPTRPFQRQPATRKHHSTPSRRAGERREAKEKAQKQNELRKIRKLKRKATTKPTISPVDVINHQEWKKCKYLRREQHTLCPGREAAPRVDRLAPMPREKLVMNRTTRPREERRGL
jgi:hypothetical protein